MTQAEQRVRIPQAVIVKDLADLLGVTPIDVIKELMKNGVMATINQVVDFDTAAVVATDLGFSADEEGGSITVAASAPAAAIAETQVASTSQRVTDDNDPNAVDRAPVVTVLGHVDHGKTTLLDSIRRANVAGGEAGGITQHIGAYQAKAPDGRTVTFIDTPGHAAFTEMRARGTQVTDVAVVVVAADDGVMPQTREAIDHARAAGVPIVVALNKIDANNANPDRVKQQLMELGMVPEEYGGEQIVVPVSALKGEGIQELLENVLVVADLQELKANPKRPAVGVILEASTDRHRGVIATVLVQTGTLRVGDVILTGMAFGKVKAMTDEHGKRVKEAGPSEPVIVLGLSDVPPAGERFAVVSDEKVARAEVEARQRLAETAGVPAGAVTLDSLFGQIHQGAVREFNIVLKTDVQGSIEPLVRALEELSVEGINVKVIHASAGTINESDVNLAVASKGVVIGFNTDPEPGARRHAEAEHVEIREYRVIYDIIDDVQRAVRGLLAPVFEEQEDARVEVRQVFRLGRRNAIAGCYVRDGTVRRNTLARIFRKGEQIAQGRVESLKRFQEDAREVASGFECGLQVEGFNDFQEGDEVVCYHMEQVRS